MPPAITGKAAKPPPMTTDISEITPMQYSPTAMKQYSRLMYAAVTARRPCRHPNGRTRGRESRAFAAAPRPTRARRARGGASFIDWADACRASARRQWASAITQPMPKPINVTLAFSISGSPAELRWLVGQRDDHGDHAESSARARTACCEDARRLPCALRATARRRFAGGDAAQSRQSAPSRSTATLTTGGRQLVADQKDQRVENPETAGRQAARVFLVGDDHAADDQAAPRPAARTDR